MKILTASQIRDIDAYTIAHEPIASIDLMERAAGAFVTWFVAHYTHAQPIKLVCGPGNNGGDGLAIARLLHEQSYPVEVYVVPFTGKTSNDFAGNLERLPDNVPVREISETAQIPVFKSSGIVIDALFGSGLSRAVSGLAAEVIGAINQAVVVVAVDIPSGLFVDAPNASGDVIVKATHTVSFHLPKLAFLLPENARFVGDWHLVDIGLHPEAIAQAQTRWLYTDEAIARAYLHQREKFSHKGTHGHALLIAGSYGMMGAAILSARACLRAGVGKLTVHAPRSANDLMQSSVPEAIFQAGPDETITLTDWNRDKLAGFAAIGIGPGLGVDEKIAGSIGLLAAHCGDIPLVMDADALNNLSTARGRSILEHLPKNTILTPHPGEFRRLLNRDWQNDYQKLDLLAEFAVRHKVIVCLKGAHTAVALSDGHLYFNSTGNPGMATGGTGDVLTGIITALLAQQYPPVQAAMLGVYLHGLAGDIAARHKSTYAMIASDLYTYLPEAFLHLIKP